MSLTRLSNKLGKFILWALLALPVHATAASERLVTLLFTNDFESAYDPTPAYWRDDLAHIGGIAQLASLVEQIRAEQPNVFLFDAGDIFTGTLAKLTQGELSFELMMTMGYDAMVIGNHEFEYGWDVLARQKHRVPFPVLGANLFYRGTDHPFAQPFTIIERHGVRIGVIGILGQDAATALVPSHIAGVEVRDPTAVVRRHVQALHDDVDLIVVLTHQGFTAPMQTDDEADPAVQRGNAENMALAGAVPGIDVILAGHTDAGTRAPLVHPDTGTLIMQTYGQGQHLGLLQLGLREQGQPPQLHDGRLLTVDSDNLPEHAGVARKLSDYRSQHAEIFEIIGTARQQLVRRYYLESDLGNLFADIIRSHAGVEIGLMPSGALRKDLPAGDIRKVDLLDAFPFQDKVAVVSLRGDVLLAIIEQGLSLERGILQVSGLTVTYNPAAPSGQRVLTARLADKAGAPQDIAADNIYQVATVEILAQGGDAYTQFHQAQQTHIMQVSFASVLEDYFARVSPVDVPRRGRLNANQ